jgi:mannose-6-phosphate isomerase
VRKASPSQASQELAGLYPLTFHPIFKERVWGDRNLERLYGKPLPPGVPIGESWEITDRPEGVSVIANGPLAGKDLRFLMQNYGKELLGKTTSRRFPLLIKILDCQKTLSVQVHPPADVAAQFDGEPKTEMWYIADATPEAALYVGLKRGVKREEFERRISEGTVAEALHRMPVKPGDVMFLPSGRVHAIGGGNVIFEIQQNSDTTYRVFDWNRPGLDGKPRELHVRESLASINFSDYEPGLVASGFSRNPKFAVRYLVDNPLFQVNACRVKRGERFYLSGEVLQILALIKGRLRVAYEERAVQLEAGGFVMLPASLGRVSINAETQVEFLQVQPG